MILAIDPSLTATGYALFAEDRSLIEAGRIKAPVQAKGKKLPASKRADIIVGDICVLASGLPVVPHTVIEIPSAHVNKRRHGGGGAGLARYGYLTGRVVQAVIELDGVVEQVEPEQWIGKAHGVPRSKADRIALAARAWPRYDPDKDKGGDIADALLLGRWAAGRVCAPPL